MIYSENDSALLLGILMNDSTKCLDTKYPLDKEDFECVLFHRTLYATIYNLAIKGVKQVDEIMVEEFLHNYPAQEQIYLDSNGRDFIFSMKELSYDKVENIQYYWEIVRKHSMLREYEKSGTNIKEIWDNEKSDIKNEEELNKWTIDEICNGFDLKQSAIRKKFLINVSSTEMVCGDGFNEFLDEVQENPMVGAGLCSPMLNELYRGWCKGHLILRGAPSSFGKTLFGLADHINVSSLKIWSDEKHDFIPNPYYQGMGAYIHSEQKTREEIQPRAVSILSKIPFSTIMDGTFSKDEKERLNEAGKILYESKFKLIDYPNFTATGTREHIRDLSLNGYEYITTDYIWNNSWIMSDMKKTMGIQNISEPAGLLYYCNSLKMDAEDFNVGVATMMQLNGKEKEVAIIDEGCLYASRAVKTKLDNGSIMTIPTAKDLNQLESFIDKWNRKNNPNNFGKRIIPNAVSNVFKARYNRHGQNIRIWHYIDRSVGDIMDLFATTHDNKPLMDKDDKIYDLPRLYIKNKQ